MKVKDSTSVSTPVTIVFLTRSFVSGTFLFREREKKKFDKRVNLSDSNVIKDSFSLFRW